MKRMKRWISILLTVVMTAGLFAGLPVNFAAAEGENWKPLYTLATEMPGQEFQAYAKLRSFKNKFASYGVFDINQDGVYEIMIYTAVGGGINDRFDEFWGYSGGKTVCLQKQLAFRGEYYTNRNDHDLYRVFLVKIVNDVATMRLERICLRDGKLSYELVKTITKRCFQGVFGGAGLGAPYEHFGETKSADFSGLNGVMRGEQGETVVYGAYAANGLWAHDGIGMYLSGYADTLSYSGPWWRAKEKVGQPKHIVHVDDFKTMKNVWPERLLAIASTDLWFFNADCGMIDFNAPDKTIHGYRGSTAQEYADAHGNPFIPIVDPDATPAFVKNYIKTYDKYHAVWERTGFHENLDRKAIRKDTAAYRIWDTLKDAGELMQLDGGDLQIFDDYYELYLADMMTALMQETTITKNNDFVKQFLQNGLSPIKTLLKDEADLKIFEKLTDVFSNKNVSAADKKEIGDLLTRIREEHPDAFKKVFSGLSLTGDVLDMLSFYADAYDAFMDTFSIYYAALIAKQTDQAFFELCYATADEMEKTDSKQAGWFRAAVEKYDSSRMTDQEYFDSFKNEAVGTVGNLFYKTFGQKTLQNVTAKGIAKIITKLHPDAAVTAPEIQAITAAYNVGIFFGDQIVHSNTDNTYYMYYVDPVEQSMQTVLTDRAQAMKDEQTEEACESYDMAFHVLKNTNLALYDKAYKMATETKFFWNDETEAMRRAAGMENVWKTADNYVEEAPTAHFAVPRPHKLMLVKCPVDVVLMNADGETVVSIVEEEVRTYADSAVTVGLYNGKKALCWPASADYAVRITAREDGAMDYEVSDCDSEGKILRTFEKTEIPLTAGREFTGSVPADGVKAADYGLRSGADWIELDGPAFTPGDVNFDGKVNSTDARTVLRAAARLETLTAEQILAADVDGSGKVNSADARRILRAAAKLEPLPAAGQITVG